MTQHVRVRLNVQAGEPPGFPDDVLHRVGRQGAATLGLEGVEARHIPPQLAEVAQLVPIHAMDAILAAFEPPDVDGALFKIDVRPAQPRRLIGPQPVAVERADQHLVAKGVAPALPRRVDQPVRLVRA